MIFIAGGTGFVGSHLVSRLVDAGFELKILTRNQYTSSPLFNHPKIKKTQGDILDKSTLIKGMEGCNLVINCVGIILETKKKTFKNIHVEGVKNLIEASKTNGVEKIIHISALGTSEKPVSKYFSTKFEGEQLIKNSGLEYTILRPSLLFGKGDKFFPVLKILVSLPVTPVIGNGKNRFQPVSVNDLAKCIELSIDNKDTDSKTFEIGGPQIFSFIEMLHVAAKVLNKKCYPIRVPAPIVKAFASVFDILLPQPPITKDQIKMLKVDNITMKNAAEEFFRLDLVNLEEGLAAYI